jgi:hypothetical protein
MHNSYIVNAYQKRRVVIVLASLVIFVFVIITNTPNQIATKPDVQPISIENSADLAIDALKGLKIKGRAPKTDYTRDKFGGDWSVTKGCNTRNIILNRDLTDTVVNDKCEVVSGTLNDPYTGKIIIFKRGSDTSGTIQIDHVVALSDAWQKGAQQITAQQRTSLANDPLELLAVDGPANLQKSDGDAATWLPSNKSFRCEYVARQIAVKQKYNLWMTKAEYDAISSILNKCSGQLLPSP